MKTRWRWKVLTIENLKKKKCPKIISEKNAPRRLMSCDISSELWLYVCAFIALGREVTLCDLTHRSHKLCQSSPKNQPGNLWVESCQFFTVFEVFPWDGKRSWKKAIVSVSESHQTKPPWQCCSHRWRPRSSRGPPSSTESLKRWQLNLLRSPALLQIHSLLQISLSDYAGKYVVLFFYPLDFTFVCPTEIIAFNDR